MSSGGYDPQFFDQLAAVEDRHFWFVSRNRLIARIAGELARGFGPGSLVMEAGCGTGNVLRFLEEACPASTVVGVDLWSEGLRHARQRTSCPLVLADINRAPFSRTFDMICLFDVLEHIGDDAAILEQLHSLLSPGGILFVTVPAHMSLWSYFDEAAHHCRRYTSAELRGKMESAGFEVRFSTEFMALLFPLVWTARRLAGLRAKAGDNHGRSAKDLSFDEFRIVPGINGVFTRLLGVENAWIARGGRFPIGTSLLAVGEKRRE